MSVFFFVLIFFRRKRRFAYGSPGPTWGALATFV